MPGTGTQQLVVFLGVALVIVRFWTSSQRSALSSLWSSGSGGGGFSAANQHVSSTPVPGWVKTRIARTGQTVYVAPGYTYTPHPGR